MKPDTKLTVKCQSSEMEKWKEEAWRRRLNLSEWVRVTLNEAAKKKPASSPAIPAAGTPTQVSADSQPRDVSARTIK